MPPPTVRRRADCRRPAGRPGRAPPRCTRDRGDAHVRLAVPDASMRLVELDVPLGEGAGLVGEQERDVAEVLDADEPLDEHLELREPARPGRQAHGHDRREELGRETDRDREREEQRVEEPVMEHDVEHEDRRGQNRCDSDQQERELPQSGLERGFGVPFAQPNRDAPECRSWFRWQPPRHRACPRARWCP